MNNSKPTLLHKVKNSFVTTRIGVEFVRNFNIDLDKNKYIIKYKYSPEHNAFECTFSNKNNIKNMLEDLGLGLFSRKYIGRIIK